MDNYTKNKLKEIKMGKLCYLVGLPRSGKSTFSKKWKTEGENRVVVTGDSIRYAVYGGGFKLEGEEKVKEILEFSAVALLSDGYDVLVDETNVKPERRKVWDKLSGTAIYIDTPLDVCLSRVIGKENDGSVIAFKEAIKLMAKDLEGASR